MNTSGLLKSAAALVVGGGALFGASAMTTPIDDQRRDLDLTLSDEELSLPPDAALTQAFLGVGRGVAVNVLWQRAERLKEEGKFYEAMQLADWITTLQPRYPKVWEFTSWNMAYNISVATNTDPERWTWVLAGIDSLRDKGIYYNPEDLALYRQLGWIFLHKVGEFQDDSNRYYKKELAGEWHEIFGGPPPVDSADDFELYRQWLQPVVDAPATLDALYAQDPEAERLVSWLRERGYVLSDDPNRARQMRQFVGDFTYQWTDFHPDDESMPHLCINGELEDWTAVKDEELDVIDETLGASATEARAQEMTYARWPSWASQETRDAVINFGRRAVIAGSPNRMDPEFMMEVAERYGPLDWRHPASHTIYWTALGLDRVLPDYEGTGTLPEGIVNTRRNILMALQQLQRSGRVTYEPQTGYHSDSADPSFFMSYLREFDATEAELQKGNPNFDADRVYGGGFRNNVDQVVSNLYLLGQNNRANEVLQAMRERYEGTVHYERFNRPLDEYIGDHLRENLENPDQARTAISFRIFAAVLEGYGRGEGERAERLIAEAKQLYDAFRREYDETTTVGDEVPPFGDVVRDEVVRAMNVADVDTKIDIWENLPDETKLRLWPTLRGPLYQHSLRIGYRFEAAYPMPDGSHLEMLKEQEKLAAEAEADAAAEGPRLERQ
jgi:hypothetical protein